MKKNRTNLQIIADILSVARSGASKTRIMQMANLSYLQLCTYLENALKGGFVSLQDNGLYVLTDKGKSYLSAHEEYSARCRNVEKELLHSKATKTALMEMCNGIVGNKPNSGITRKRQGRPTSNAAKIKGVVLAAGEGSRIRRVTYGGFPKELLPIGNIPTIRFPIEGLRLAGIKDIFIVIAPQTKHGIIDGLQSGNRFAVNISYVVQEAHEKHPSGLGSAILSVRGNIRADENLLVACGDTILCDFSSDNPLNCLESLVRVHRSVDALATVMVYPSIGDPTRFGVVKFRTLNDENGVLNGELENLIEKPNVETAKDLTLNGYYYIIAGYYIFKPEIFSYIEKTSPTSKNEIQITDAMALALRNGEKIYAVVHAKNRGKDMVPCEYWDVGIPEDYKTANRRLLDTNIDELVSLEGR